MTKRREEMVDLEQQFVLRLPPTAAENLKKDLHVGGMSLKDKLSLEIHPETRRGKVVYDGQMYNAKLVDIPCIVESYKSTDRKTFYKCADISQMLMCKNEFADDSPDDDNNNIASDAGMKKKEKDKRFMWNHGLCPPLKNVRKRRFRRTLQKKHPEQPDIERELRRLFSMDAQAIDVKWEVIYEQEKQDGAQDSKTNLSVPVSKGNHKQNLNASGSSGGGGGKTNTGNKITNSINKILNSKKKKVMESLVKDVVESTNDSIMADNSNSNIVAMEIGDGDKSRVDMSSNVDENSRMFADHDIFGDVSSSDNDDEDNDDDDNSNVGGGGIKFKRTNQNEDDSMIGEEATNHLSDGEIPSENAALVERLSDLRRKMNECKTKRLSKETELNKTTETDLKNLLQDEIHELNSKESNLDKEISILQSMMEE